MKNFRKNPDRLIKSFIAVFFVFLLPDSLAQKNVYPDWKHYSIDPILPGSSWGTGGPALADFDRDGDLDAAVSRRNTKSAYWYQRINDSIWIPHLMGYSDALDNTLGTTPADIDHDSWDDVVFQGVWFTNPGTLGKNPDTPWKVNLTKAGGHDATNVDIDSNGQNDLLVYDGNKIAWYNTSNQLREIIISSGYDDHGGVAPHGFGDIDGDNDPDVVIPGYWFANPGDQTANWKRFEWPFEVIPNASYGRSIRAWIADINNDGSNDIVYSHCDTGGSHVYWVENRDNGKIWESHQLPDPPVRKGDVPGTGSFHSLCVADINQDGHPDIFAGEQEDPDTYMEADGKLAMKPRGLKSRGAIWYNNGNKNPQFEIYVIHVGNPGWHDAQIGDVDKDGDLDIVSKIWNADGPVYHLDYWRNELVGRTPDQL
jgi:hypothetical protein